MIIYPVLRDYRSIFLLVTLLAMLGLFIKPVSQQYAPQYNFTFVVDITRSMNAADYKIADQAVSRLEFVKHQLRALLHHLPCSTKIGLAVFTERRSSLLFEPVEICTSYTELDTAISKLDWRMAWAADSNIAKGLFNTLAMLQKSHSTVVFITDGQEAPPVNPSYLPDFAAMKGKAKGLIVGTGGLQAVPIPKFDAQGNVSGFYQQDDVPHRSSFGQSNLDPSQIEGYDARNAPFGSKAVVGNEHLSALQESYLTQLAHQAGLNYTRLTDLEPLQQALQSPEFSTQQLAPVDVRGYFAAVALLMFCCIYLPPLSSVWHWFRLKKTKDNVYVD
ncbi:vWA domain-containing protein [Crenothrix polyspora]|uniref:von Willebrand factor type A n=1 Tax=Crenothrix polyspora TaxID=360316 RepID=A0A1R4H228_9GAMM|nr:vWA domain-containing protein [Crenothrix polyspora]SJM90297.1 von Willebrand factor type A [Crenothrix polyspora]